MKANMINLFQDNQIQNEFENIYKILNGISFGTTVSSRCENFDGYIMDVTANSVASEDTQISHDLNRVPYGYLIIGQNATSNFYNGTGTNTETLFFLKSTTASCRFKVILI